MRDARHCFKEPYLGAAHGVATLALWTPVAEVCGVVPAAVRVAESPRYEDKLAYFRNLRPFLRIVSLSRIELLDFTPHERPLVSDKSFSIYFPNLEHRRAEQVFLKSRAAAVDWASGWLFET